MRTETSNGVTIKYPEAIAFCFNRCPIVVSGDNASQMKVTISSKGKTSEHYIDAHKGKCQDDVRQYIHSFLDGEISEEMYYTPNGYPTNLGRNFDFSVMVFNEEGNRLVSFGFDVYYIWGALQLGKKYTLNGYRRLTWFRNFPFSFSLYNEQENTIIYAPNGRLNDFVEIDTDGLMEFCPNLPSDAKTLSVYDYSGRITQATFDLSFDLTFYLKTGDQKKLLDIEIDDHTEGTYLRWINRYGQYCYYLFCEGSRTTKASATTSFLRDDLSQYDDTYGYHGEYGNRTNYAREDVLPLCAPMVDRDTFDFLQEIATAVIVDKYCGKDENGKDKWMGVQIQPASYTKDFRKQLQDFEFNMVLPPVDNQEL